jgi:hypothetical protein
MKSISMLALGALECHTYELAAYLGYNTPGVGEVDGTNYWHD